MKDAELLLDDSRADASPPVLPSPDVGTLLPAIKLRHADRITGELIIPARPGSYSDFPSNLDPRLVAALQGRGIRKLYSHQRAAWDAITAGKHTVVVTPTASGKTLCYNLPVLQSAMQEHAKALYLFPTKALAQDQVAELLELNNAGGLGVRAFTFDGDTPGDARQAVRTRGDIVVSNPDMLHQGILPHHTKWAQFFENSALRGHRRDAYVSRRLRLAHGECHPAAAAGLPVLRSATGVHLLFGDDRQSG